MTRETTGGFEPRFNVTRTDGKPCRAEARYIVLDYAGDPHAKAALAVYADSIEAENPALAADFRDALVNPAAHPAQHENAMRKAISSAELIALGDRPDIAASVNDKGGGRAA